MFVLVAPTVLSFLLLSCGQKHTVTEKYRVNHLGVPSMIKIVQSEVQYSSFEPVHEIDINFVEDTAMFEYRNSMRKILNARFARLMCRFSGADVTSSVSNASQDQLYKCSLQKEKVHARLDLAKQRFKGMELIERIEEDHWGFY